MTAQLIQELMSVAQHMKHDYERKLFIVGLSELLQNEILPESLRPLLVGLINQVIDNLMSLIKAQDKEAKKKAKAEMNNGEDDSEDEENQLDSDDSDEDIEDEYDNDSFGNLLDTINYYMNYGREQLVSTQ